ncbi:MAG TPA: hypothetical protein VK157_03955, partial [Phycisphaerales bacterium]|nr:hypothetical protein [Phycisphaerales bacterium]
MLQNAVLLTAMVAGMCAPASGQSQLGPPLPDPSAPTTQLVQPTRASVADLMNAAQTQDINPLAVIDSAGQALPRSGGSTQSGGL